MKRYRNFYTCSECHHSWQDVWDSTCNDRCPNCNAEIEPYRSEDIPQVTVYHVAGFMHHGFVLGEPLWLASKAMKVAEVETDRLDEAYEWANNINKSWVSNDGVVSLAGNRVRSTSAGDIMEKDGTFFSVELDGFRELTPEEIKAFKLEVPA